MGVKIFFKVYNSLNNVKISRAGGSFITAAFCLHREQKGKGKRQAINILEGCSSQYEPTHCMDLSNEQEAIYYRLPLAIS